MTLRKRARRSHSKLTAHKIYEICTGKIEEHGLYYDGYSTDGSADIEAFIDDVRRDWEAFGDQLLSWFVGGAKYEERPTCLGSSKPKPWLLYCDRPGKRPWAWWQFDAPEPLTDDETQFEYLQRHDLLLPGELEAGKRYEAKVRADELEMIIYDAEIALGIKYGPQGWKHDEPEVARRKLDAAEKELADLESGIERLQ